MKNRITFLLWAGLPLVLMGAALNGVPEQLLPSPAPLLVESGCEGLMLWLDATDADSLIRDDAGRIVEWRDQSGSGHHLVQLEPGERPVSENQAVQFRGGEWLTVAAKPSTELEMDGGTVFIVFETEEEHPLRFMGLLGNGGHGNDGTGFTVGFNDRDIITQNNAAALLMRDGGMPGYEAGGSAEVRRLKLNRLLAPRYANLLGVVWNSGEAPFARVFYFGEDQSEGMPAFPAGLRVAPLAGLTVGAADAQGAFPFKGRMMEVRVYDRALGDDERKAVEEALVRKHGLSKPSALVFDARAEPLALARASAVGAGQVLLRLSDGVLYESHDGERWEVRCTMRCDPDFPDIVPGGLVVRTATGTLISITGNRCPAYWTKLTRVDGKFTSDEAKSHIFALRSVDGGRTWQDGQLLQTDYCGALRDIIVTRQGHIVASVQSWDRKHERHITTVHVSADDGLSYQRADVDNGIGMGLHDGFFEATLAELYDGRIWMLARTSLGYFWESFSTDGGFSWSPPEPTEIDAGGYPGFLLRLAGGRLALAWNRYYPVGYEGRSDLINEAAKSWFWGLTKTSRYNSQLSLMFSDDDGRNWSQPVVVAAGRQDFASLRYPVMFEKEPGIVYLWAGPAALRFREKDFVGVE